MGRPASRTPFVGVSPTLQTLGEEAWGRQADGECHNGADDGGVDEDLQQSRARTQAEDRLQGVVGVGEGDETSECLEYTGRRLVAEKSGNVDQGEQYSRRIKEHVGRR